MYIICTLLVEINQRYTTNLCNMLRENQCFVVLHVYFAESTRTIIWGMTSYFLLKFNGRLNTYHFKI